MLTMLVGAYKIQGKADEARRSCRSSRFIDKVYILGHFPKPEGRRAADVVHHHDFALSKGIAKAKARYLRWGAASAQIVSRHLVHIRGS